MTMQVNPMEVAPAAVLSHLYTFLGRYTLHCYCTQHTVNCNTTQSTVHCTMYNVQISPWVSGVCMMQPLNVFIQQVKKLYGPTSLCLEPLDVCIKQEKKLHGPTYLHLEPTYLHLEPSNVFIQP